jgi:DNA-binding CsgD family transcriptional regulator
LAVSPGTVKNHRYRIYFKLDITTEREMFSRFLNDILLSS